MTQLPLTFDVRYVTVLCTGPKGTQWTHLLAEHTAERDCRDIERDLPGVRAEVVR